MMRRTALTPAPKGPQRSMAICMCAYNEERVIVAKAESLLRMAEQYGAATIHIYVDGATDRTVELLQPYSNRIDVVVSKVRSGKTAGMNILVARTNADLIACTDANVRATDDSLVRLSIALNHPTIACASARLVYDNGRESGSSAAGAAYWTLEEWVKGLESRTISLIGVDGALFLIERAAYRATPPHLIDDLCVSLNVLLDGRRVVSCPEVLVTERSAVSWAEEFRRKRRIACQGINVHRAMWPKLAALPPAMLYGYISHRLLKLLIPFNLAVSGLCFWAALASFVGTPAALALIVAGAGLLLPIGLLGLSPMRFVLGVVVALSGVGSGVLEALVLNRTYSVWTPAASVRD
jgi:cellulose synthase/poly-beta-1,6-N-acetylglucosamine synthase-like glycosyltransferase